MKTNRIAALSFLIALTIFALAGCTAQPVAKTNANATASAVASVSPSPVAANTAPVTLPVLDALFSDEAFKQELKTKLALTDVQVAQLQKISGDEVARLRELNAEDQVGEQSEQAESQAVKSRDRAVEAIRGALGEQKANDLFAFAHDYWINGANTGEATTAKPADKNGPAAPNAIPKDTRVVVNIPAYRMDVFKDGSLVKSYKIGIGYPEFPLPTGLRKAQSIIFNPTWTPPDEPWVAKMKNVSVGEKVAAGSKLNPLGPIKIPIGLPSLIHGGKSPAKLGTFASHGCVGLTTAQVQDFAKLLAQVAGSDISDAALKSYFAEKDKTKTVKLDQAVPVELRYETIVVEDGKLHIYRDVYDQDTNTEENLRAVLSANGVNLEDLKEDERTQVMDALNAMSRNPAAKSTASPTASASPASAAPTKDKKEIAKTKTEVAKAKKPIGKNQKEVVIEIAALSGKGYPAAVNLDTGSGKPAAVAVAAKPAL